MLKWKTQYQQRKEFIPFNIGKHQMFGKVKLSKSFI